MRHNVKTKVNECKRKQIKEIKAQLRILKKSVKRLREQKPVYYRNSKENMEIVKIDTTLRQLENALNLLQSKSRKVSSNKV